MDKVLAIGFGGEGLFGTEPRTVPSFEDGIEMRSPLDRQIIAVHAARCVTRAAVTITLILSLAAPAIAGAAEDLRLDVGMRYFRTAERAAPGSSTRRANYLKAERIAEDLVSDAPRLAQAHFLLFAARGRRLLDESGKPSPRNFWKFSGLSKHLSRALELDPSHANALAAKGGLLLDLPPYLGGDVKAARRHLERALKLNPTGPGTRLTLARALAKQGLAGPAREQARLAAHYACVRRKQITLREAEQLLASLASAPL